MKGTWRMSGVLIVKRNLNWIVHRLDTYRAKKFFVLIVEKYLNLANLFERNRKMNKEKLNKILKEHKQWIGNVGGKRANLQDANLRNADLRNADLQDADLRNANLDFSCWPLWCGSLGVKLDIKQKRQLLYHVLAVAPEFRTPKLLKEANKFHRIPDVPKLLKLNRK